MEVVVADEVVERGSLHGVFHCYLGIHGARVCCRVRLRGQEPSSFLLSGVQAAVAIGVSFVDDSLTYVSITSCRKAALSLQEPLPPLSSPSIIDRSCLPPALLLLPFSSFSLLCLLRPRRLHLRRLRFAVRRDWTGRDGT